MEPTTDAPYQLPPIEDAKRQYVELFGSALVMNTYLKIALLCVSLVALGLLLLNFRTQSRYANGFLSEGVAAARRSSKQTSWQRHCDGEKLRRRQS